jgi:hypothetical protein
MARKGRSRNRLSSCRPFLLRFGGIQREIIRTYRKFVVRFLTEISSSGDFGRRRDRSRFF